eukprot:CAMPEP_0174274764 /NCGR_PEP_ID=MMETSP0439-20130205/59180_1 /TAXON_ID=0 /ORGANISM="Stereomyxa ramosa, Strain Chinc5" /LENGTH=455 /DNA_ID=CAMNT_0015366753 /DNA_START=351 /DNA_END=1718 /DNA_ORIENTATION=-
MRRGNRVIIHEEPGQPAFRFQITWSTKAQKHGERGKLIFWARSKVQKAAWVKDFKHCLWIAEGKKGPDPSGKNVTPHPSQIQSNVSAVTVNSEKEMEEETILFDPYSDNIPELEKKSLEMERSAVWNPFQFGDLEWPELQIEDEVKNMDLNSSDPYASSNVSKPVSFSEVMFKPNRVEVIQAPDSPLLTQAMENVNFRSASEVTHRDVNSVVSARLKEQKKNTATEDAMAELQKVSHDVEKMIVEFAAILKKEQLYNSSEDLTEQIEQLAVEDELKSYINDILRASQELIEAAIEAQAERPVHISEYYISDSVWPNGLISASVEMAETLKYLVRQAMKVHHGEEGDPYLLIAAAKIVNSSIAHLVAAHSVKADLGSESYRRMQLSTYEVGVTTGALVSLIMSGKEEETETESEDSTIETGVSKTVQEMELQSKLIQLEKEKEETFAQLKKLRNSK